jgi:hypothetical protein
MQGCACADVDACRGPRFRRAGCLVARLPVNGTTAGSFPGVRSAPMLCLPCGNGSQIAKWKRLTPVFCVEQHGWKQRSKGEHGGNHASARKKDSERPKRSSQAAGKIRIGSRINDPTRIYSPNGYVSGTPGLACSRLSGFTAEVSSNQTNASNCWGNEASA